MDTQKFSGQSLQKANHISLGLNVRLQFSHGKVVQSR